MTTHVSTHVSTLVGCLPFFDFVRSCSERETLTSVYLSGTVYPSRNDKGRQKGRHQKSQIPAKNYTGGTLSTLLSLNKKKKVIEKKGSIRARESEKGATRG